MSPSAFDAEKYQKLMDGLECSEVNYSYVMNKSDIHRLDSFFFAKEFLQDEDTLLGRNHITLSEIDGVQLLSFGAYSLMNYVTYQNEGVPFIRCVDMKNGFVDTDNLTYITQEANKLLYKSAIYPETVLLSMSGSIGNVAIAQTNWHYPINSNQDIAKIHLNGKLNPYVVYCFFRSKFGQNYLHREARGSVQQHVFLSQIEKITIPVFDDIFVRKIEEVCKKAFSLKDKASMVYNNAEQRLLSELDISSEDYKSGGVSIQSFSSSFGKTGRLDAEYYEPKYERLSNHIRANTTIGEACQIYDKNILPKKGKAYPYIELANIGEMGSITGVEIIDAEELPTRARRRVHVGQVIVSSIEGSLPSCALVTDDYNGAFCSTGFYVLDSKQYNSETLLVLMKSPLMQSLLKRGCSGTILTNIQREELEKIPMPKISDSTQYIIKENIREMYSLRELSKKMLSSAVRAVEIAIEKDEETALSYLEANM